MKDLFKCIGCALLALIILILLLYGIFIYNTRYKITEINFAVSPDGLYVLIFQAVGEPDWPFGPSRARITLKDGKKEICHRDFIVLNDGATLHADNWHTTWQADRVIVTISGKEQKDEIYVFSFDGHIVKADSIDSSIIGTEYGQAMPAIGVCENRPGEYAFSISRNDFVAAFNALYEKDWGRPFFPEESNWISRHYDTGIHTDYPVSCDTYTEDEDLYVLPTISVYLTNDTSDILEVSVNFDWHSYTEALYAQYQQLCFYALKVFFPSLSDDQILVLCREMNATADSNIYPSDQWYGHGAVPYEFCYSNQTGFYAYSAIGDWMHFCIIPAYEDLLNAFQQQGVQTNEIS